MYLPVFSMWAREATFITNSDAIKRKSSQNSHPSKLSCDPAGKKYAEYCRYALIKYRPWEGSILNAWGENAINEWYAFLAALASNGIRPPDFLDREINAYLAIQKKNLHADGAAGMLINPGADGAGDILEEGGQDEWLHGIDDSFVLIDDDVEDATGVLE